MGKTVTIFRLFDGRVCDSEDNVKNDEKKTIRKYKGGRMA